MAADIRQFHLGRLPVGEFDRRRRDMESRIVALERENANLKFMNKQCSAQYKKLERDYVAQEKIVRGIQKCAACVCLENRRGLAQGAEGGRTWDTLLAETATAPDTVTNAAHNTHTTDSTSSRTASLRSAQHTNPSDLSRREGLNEEVHLLRDMNARLQTTIDQLQTDVNRKAVQISSLQRRTNETPDRSSGQILAAKEREIKDLRSQVSELLVKNMEKTTAATSPQSNRRGGASTDRALEEVQTTVRQFERELVALREQRRELTGRLSGLEEDVSTKEKSLKRCERLLEQANKDKERLAAEAQRLKRNDRPTTQPTLEVTAPVNRSRSELALNNVAGRSRPSSRSRSPFGGTHSANVYCPVCREMRDQLQNLPPPTRPQSASRSPVRLSARRPAEKPTSSPDSGFADRADKDSQLLRLREQLNREQLNNRLLKHERDSLKQLHEKANAEADRLRRELLQRHSRPTTSAGSAADASDKSPHGLVARLRADNDKLRRQLQVALNTLLEQTLKEQFESDNARHKANESLITAQKIKAEQDYREALLRYSQSETRVAALSRQLAEREISIEQLNAQLIHQLSLRTTDSSGASGVRAADGDNLIADLTGKLRRAEAGRTAAESNSAALRRQLEDARADSSRLEVDVLSLRRQLQQLADSSGDSAGANSATLKLLLRDKDLEINALRSRVRDLDVEYQKFESGLAEQQATLYRLQQDLSVSSSQKIESEKRCMRLQEENGRLATRINQLENDNSALRTELESALAQQDYLNASAEKYISEIQSYQRLLSEKEAQRAALLTQLQDAKVQGRRSDSVRATQSSDDLAAMEANLHDLQLQSVRDELDSARAEKSKLVDERRTLEARINRCERELDALRSELNAERGQKESLHADLAAARQQLIAADNHAIDLTAKLSHVETELQKARAQIDSLSGDVELQKAKAMAAAATVSELEQTLAVNRQQYADAVRDAQQRATDVQTLKERIYDYEAKLELQARDLIDTRSKFSQAEKDLTALRRELSDERFERQRLQSRVNNSQSTASS